MSTFSYDPNAAKAWANSILNYLNGGSESISVCSRKFNEQTEKLVQPNVWTGPAALKNYQDFLETHQALVRFVNSFGEAFEQAMNSINTSVSNLEIANAGGVGNSISSNFGSLSFEQLTNLSQENINKDVVRYDYVTITSIGSALNNIYGTLESVNTSLNNKINELNNGSSIWDGNAAEKAKETLSETLRSNMSKVLEALNICIKNIQEAAEAAEMADRG